MSKSLVLFKTELDTLNAFSNEMQKGFEKVGYEIFIFDVTDTIKSMGLLYEYIKTHTVIAMIGFNNRTVTASTSSGANIWETLGIFCINILVDNPYWYHDILMKMPNRSAVLTIDRNHMNYVARFYPEICMTGFLAHGGTNNGRVLSYEDRTMDMLYVGSIYKPSYNDINRDYSSWDFDAKKVIKETTDYLLSCPDDTIDSVIEKKLLENGIKLSDEELRFFIHYNAPVERIVSSYYREKLLSVIADSGMKLTIYGKGFDDCRFMKNENVSYEGFISPEAVIERISKSKVLINSMPWFKDGSHERIFAGMLCGTAVMTEDNPYTKETCGNTYISYKLNDESIRNACDVAKEVMDNKSAFENLTGKAYDNVNDKHTWIQRALEIHEDILKLL